jgi:hypothetical protein
MRKAVVILAASLIAGAGLPLVAQSGARNGEWTSYGGDLGHTRYSALDQINASNFNTLDVAWRFKPDNGPRPEFSSIDAADGEGRRLRQRDRGARWSRSMRPRRMDARRTKARAARRHRGSVGPRSLVTWTDGSEQQFSM